MNAGINAEMEKRLVEHGIRPTAMRALIMSVIDAADHPLSAQEIEDILETVDRSTITRALSLFAEHDVVHIIDDGSGTGKYERCPSCEHHAEESAHVHFHCDICGDTICLNDTPVPFVPLPEGFTPRRLNYVISGICGRCSRR